MCKVFQAYSYGSNPDSIRYIIAHDRIEKVYGIWYGIWNTSTESVDKILNLKMVLVTNCMMRMMLVQIKSSKLFDHHNHHSAFHLLNFK